MGQKSEASYHIETSLQIHFKPCHEQTAKQVHSVFANLATFACA